MVQFLNFGHSLSPQALGVLCDMLGEAVIETHIPLVLDFARPIQDQSSSIAGILPVIEDDCIVGLPGSSILTAAVIAAVSGKLGVMPRVLIMIKVDAGFIPAEIVDLHIIKTASRVTRDAGAIKL